MVVVRVLLPRSAGLGEGVSQIGDLVVDEGVVYVVVFDGRQSLLGVRTSMAPMIQHDVLVRHRPQTTKRRYMGRRLLKPFRWGRT